MATVKSHTDLSQSKTLSKILPLESADQTWERIAIAGANLDVPEELQYRHNGDMLFQYYSGIGTPCWSLEAMLNILPDGINVIKDKSDTENEKYMCTVEGTNDIITTFGNNPVDACYEIIIKLHELNLL